MRRLLSPLLPLAAVCACADPDDHHDGQGHRPDADTAQPEVDTNPVPRVDGALRWVLGRAEDPVLSAFLETPEVRARGFAPPDGLILDVHGDLTGIARVSREDGAEVALLRCNSRDGLYVAGLVVDCALAFEPFSEGEVLHVEVEVRGGTHTLRLTVPAPPQRKSAIQALSGYDDGEVLWLGTAHYGLVGLGADTMIRYPGVLSLDAYDPAHPGPQASAILALEPDPTSGGLWIASAVTGLSWFYPGELPMSARDDVWRHVQPLLASTGVAEEL
ncbi:MAG TPA: hypothetical protein PK095_19265, partial [Myxococcota bacterium]|nr:hypothetical protein [Myxococcota bacterium]